MSANASHRPHIRARRRRWGRSGALTAAVATGLSIAFPAVAHAAVPSTVGIAASPAGGDWTVDSAGTVTAWNGAPNLGGLSGQQLNAPIVGIAASPSGHGYWLVASDGGIFTFGDAPFLGSMGGVRLNQPVVGMAADSTGRGYWLVASDGGIFTFGDAPFLGSMGGVRLNQPVVGMAADSTGRGYWLVASDGGIFTFGDAPFLGSMGGVRLNQPVVGMAADSTGRGYWLVASDGGIFAFGDAPFRGSEGSDPAAGGVVGIAPASQGYSLVNRGDGVAAFGVPAPQVTPGSSPVPAGGGWFSPSSPVNQALPAATPNVGMPGVAGGATADIYEFGNPVYVAGAATPRVRVNCTENWGTCDLSRQLVPVPPGATPSSGSDAGMVVVDPAAHLAYEFWQAHANSDGTWTASWGAVVSTLGSGNSSIYGGPGNTGSGLSELYGVATIGEVQSGVIPHALSFSSSYTCSTWVSPATKSDGHASSNCIPEGARVRLDPSINLAAIPGITPFELAVGRALQTYGAFCRDSGGAPLALQFQDPGSGPDPYAALGAPGDYYTMPHIPWGSIQRVS